MSAKTSRDAWVQRIKTYGLAVAGFGTLVGATLATYWSYNYFRLKKLDGYTAPAAVHVKDANLASIPFKMNYRVLNLDKCV